jgi:hypothetical protein
VLTVGGNETVRSFLVTLCTGGWPVKEKCSWRADRMTDALTIPPVDC